MTQPVQELTLVPRKEKSPQEREAFEKWMTAKELVGIAESDLLQLRDAERQAYDELMGIMSGANVSITPTQRKVLEMLRAEQLTNKEMGKRLGIAERTVKMHVSKLLKKYKVDNRVKLMRLL